VPVAALWGGCYFLGASLSLKGGRIDNACQQDGEFAVLTVQRFHDLIHGVLVMVV
jgi:hypothetical protein